MKCSFVKYSKFCVEIEGILMPVRKKLWFSNDYVSLLQGSFLRAFTSENKLN